MRLIDGDVLKESLKESRDNCSLWLQDCKEARSQKWIGRAEQALITFNECLMRIDTIPTIEPRQKTGKWVQHPGYREWDVCSACGIGCKRREYGEQDGHEWMTEHSYQFCPWCGAKMEVEYD